MGTLTSYFVPLERLKVFFTRSFLTIRQTVEERTIISLALFSSGGYANVERNWFFGKSSIPRVY
ncbi:MAG: hypothetical protein ACTHWQ_10200, partial [Sphingobacterium sp.]